MEDRHGIKEFKALLGLFGLAPETVDKVDRLLHASGEYNRLPSNWRSMDTTTKMLIKRLIGDSKTVQAPDEHEALDDDPDTISRDEFEGGQGSGMEAQGQEDQASGSPSSRFEGFKGGFQDFLKEVTISVDSDDPAAAQKMKMELRKAQSGTAGAKAIARQNVQAATAARTSIDDADPQAMEKKREFKRREMAAREERKRVMSTQQSDM